MTTIPDWNAQGVIPPVDPLKPTSPDRSPYTVSLVEVMRRFATSPERAEILHGLLNFRAALHQIGLMGGFQWLDGSFLENKEVLLKSAPNDIDAVTFFQLPSNTTEAELIARNSSLFDHDFVKKTFHVDSFFQPLYIPPERLIAGSNYWYGMWSHQRDSFLWKGFLCVSLSSLEDATATQSLATPLGGVTP